ncbi:MAG: hypothetical protein ACKVZJ_05270 [Phycisphaerales bacterium]
MTDEDIRAGTWELIRALHATRSALGDLAPASDLWNLVANKLAGYNAHLESWFATAAATHRALLESRSAPANLLLHAATGLYPQESLLHEMVRREGGAVVHLRGAAHARRLLARHHPPWSASPEYVPLEVPLQSAACGAVAPTTPSNGSVVFVGSMSNYFNPMLPLINALVQRGTPCLVVAPRESRAWSTTARLDTRATLVCFEDLISEPLWQRLGREQQRFRERWPTVAAAVSEAISFKGISLWPLVATDVERTLADYLPQACVFREAGRMLGALVGAKVVVTARLRRVADGAVALGLKDAGARCIVLPHGHIAPDPRSEFGAGSFEMADVVAAWGPDQARTLAERMRGDCEPEKVLVTGNPEWEALRARRPSTQPRTEIRRIITEQFRVEPAPRLGVIISQPVGPALLRHALEGCTGVSGWRFLVKAHPGDDQSTVAQLVDSARAAGANAGLAPHGSIDLHDLLGGADVSVVFSSTANVESLLVGTPVITLDLPELNAFQRHPKFENFGLPLARSAAELRQKLESIEAWAPGIESGMRAALAAMTPGPDAPPAIDRLVELIESTLGAPDATLRTGKS